MVSRVLSGGRTRDGVLMELERGSRESCFVSHLDDVDSSGGVASREKAHPYRRMRHAAPGVNTLLPHFSGRGFRYQRDFVVHLQDLRRLV